LTCMDIRASLMFLPMETIRKVSLFKLLFSPGYLYF
jgi:hypothetical protein